jgi:hypothetical protein
MAARKQLVMENQLTEVVVMMTHLTVLSVDQSAET